MIRISNIKLPLDYTEEQLVRAASKKAGHDLKSYSYQLAKKSVDARDKNDIYFVMGIDVDIPVHLEHKFLKKYDRDIKKAGADLYKYPDDIKINIDKRPLVIGSGPAGMFAALVLAGAGLKPVLIERGRSVDGRTDDVNKFWATGLLDTRSNVQFGEGGAGTFSDGKLTTGIKDTRCEKVLQEFCEAGAPEEIKFISKAHIGTDILKTVVQNIRNKIYSLGGEYRFETRLTDLIIEKGRVQAAVLEDKNGRSIFPAENIILAIGHSARDTFEMLLKNGLYMSPKPFSMGVRIEHPQSMINRVQYGKFAEHPRLGAADYKLFTHLSSGRTCYTFCMCPGGYVVAAASEKDSVCTNGMSEYRRDGMNANSAVLVTIGPEDFGTGPLDGMNFQREIEKRAFTLGGGGYKAPAQLTGDFLKGVASGDLGSVEPTYKPGISLTDLNNLFPDFISNSIKEAIPGFNQMIEGFSRYDSVMTGVEARSSSPVKIIRDDKYESNIRGLFPCGEGAGYAGGIMSAAVDGIKTAEAVISSFKER